MYVDPLGQTIKFTLTFSEVIGLPDKLSDFSRAQCFSEEPICVKVSIVILISTHMPQIPTDSFNFVSCQIEILKTDQMINILIETLSNSSP